MLTVIQLLTHFLLSSCFPWLVRNVLDLVLHTQWCAKFEDCLAFVTCYHLIYLCILLSFSRRKTVISRRSLHSSLYPPTMLRQKEPQRNILHGTTRIKIKLQTKAMEATSSTLNHWLVPLSVAMPSGVVPQIGKSQVWVAPGSWTWHALSWSYTEGPWCN